MLASTLESRSFTSRATCLIASLSPTTDIIAWASTAAMTHSPDWSASYTTTLHGRSRPMFISCYRVLYASGGLHAPKITYFRKSTPSFSFSFSSIRISDKTPESLGRKGRDSSLDCRVKSCVHVADRSLFFLCNVRICHIQHYLLFIFRVTRGRKRQIHFLWDPTSHVLRS